MESRKIYDIVKEYFKIDGFIEKTGLYDENMIINNTIISSISNVVTPVEIDDFLDDIY